MTQCCFIAETWEILLVHDIYSGYLIVFSRHSRLTDKDVWIRWNRHIIIYNWEIAPKRRSSYHLRHSTNLVKLVKRIRNVTNNLKWFSSKSLAIIVWQFFFALTVRGRSSDEFSTFTTDDAQWTYTLAEQSTRCIPFDSWHSWIASRINFSTPIFLLRVKKHCESNNSPDETTDTTEQTLLFLLHFNDLIFFGEAREEWLEGGCEVFCRMGVGWSYGLIWLVV